MTTPAKHQGLLPVAHHQERVQSLRRKYGDHHLCVAEAWNSVGLVYRYVSRDYSASLRCFQEALSILRTLLIATKEDYCNSSGRTDNSNVLLTCMGVTMVDIAEALKMTGDTDGAVKFYREAIDTFRSVGMRDDHIRVDAALRGISNIGRMWTTTSSSLSPQPLPPRTTKPMMKATVECLAGGRDVHWEADPPTFPFYKLPP